VVSFAIPSLGCQSQPLHSASREFLDKFEKYLIQINMARFCLRILQMCLACKPRLSRISPGSFVRGKVGPAPSWRGLLFTSPASRDHRFAATRQFVIEQRWLMSESGTNRPNEDVDITAAFGEITDIPRKSRGGRIWPSCDISPQDLP
jgi:hypothetical protein